MEMEMERSRRPSAPTCAEFCEWRRIGACSSASSPRSRSPSWAGDHSPLSCSLPGFLLHAHMRLVWITVSHGLRSRDGGGGRGGRAVLPVAWAFSVTGITAGILIMVVVAANAYTCDLLLRQAFVTGCLDYETLGLAVGGRAWRVNLLSPLIVASGILGSNQTRMQGPGFFRFR
jgi:hypothetical protein